MDETVASEKRTADDSALRSDSAVPPFKATLAAQHLPDHCVLQPGALRTQMWTLLNSGTSTWKGVVLQPPASKPLPFCFPSEASPVPEVDPGTKTTLRVTFEVPKARAEPHVVTYRLAVKTSDGTSHVFGPSLPVVFVTTTDAPAARRAAGAGVPLSSRAPPAPFVAPGEMLRALEVMDDFAGAGSAHMVPEVPLLPELSLPDVSLPEMLLPGVPRLFDDDEDDW